MTKTGRIAVDACSRPVPRYQRPCQETGALGLRSANFDSDGRPLDREVDLRHGAVATTVGSHPATFRSRKCKDIDWGCQSASSSNRRPLSPSPKSALQPNAVTARRSCDLALGLLGWLQIKKVLSLKKLVAVVDQL